MLHHPVQIGSYIVKGNIFLAPVAGYSDAAYRSICLGLGADFAFTELVSSEALIRDSSKTELLLRRFDNETDYAVQLFGRNPSVMAKAAAIAFQTWHPALIDINCGCPVPKVVKTGAGSALMKTPELAAEIVGAIKAAVPVPITVKMRLGWDEHSINYLEFADKLVAAGADALALHARTRKQGYSGTADRNAFFALARHVDVPVIASGDMFSVHDVIDVLSRDNEGRPVQAIMLARGIMGKPFLFRELRRALDAADAGLAQDQAQEDTIGRDEIIRTAERHLALMTELYGEARACVEFRKHMCAYLKGVQGGAALRNRAVHAESWAEYKELFELWSC